MGILLCGANPEALIRVGCAYYYNVEEARRLVGLGIAALTVDPRTRRRANEGKADWAWIREVKQVVRIPVVGNGDVVTPLDVKRNYGGDAFVLLRRHIQYM